MDSGWLINSNQRIINGHITSSIVSTHTFLMMHNTTVAGNGTRKFQGFGIAMKDVFVNNNAFMIYMPANGSQLELVVISADL